MTCSICGTIPARATANTGRDEYFQAPITSLRSLKIDRDDDLRECPDCGSMFLWHDGRSFTGSGNNDEEVLTRFSEEETSMLRAFVHRGDRAAEEVASMADRWLALPGPAPNLVSRWVLQQDPELSRALVLRMLDAMERGAPPDLRRRFVEDYASDHDAAFVKSELERRPPAAVFERTRALCRRLLCSICRAIPFYPSLQTLPPGIRPHGASPTLDAAECPECGSMFLLEGEQWSRLLDFAADALRACLHRDGAVSEHAQEMVIASDRRRSLKIALAHGMKRDRELIRQFVPRLIREMALNEPPWLQELLSEFVATPADAAVVLEAIARASHRSPKIDLLSARCRAVLEAENQ